MSRKKPKPFARIAITLPPEVLKSADRLAGKLDRSRSWVVAEAIRRYAASAAERTPGLVAEEPARYDPRFGIPIRPGLGPYRQLQLESDLRLTPEERIRAAEETALISRLVRKPGQPPRPEPDFRKETGEFGTRLALVCDRVNREGGKYLVIGAVAMQLWGTSRSTRDIDLLIEPTVENAERILRGLSQVGFRLAEEWLPEEVAKRPFTIIGDSPRVDLLTVACGVGYASAAPRATTFDIEGVKIPTASIEDLIASKRTDRLQDAADIEVLEEIRRLRPR
jgi:predicted nucleotidyltransferase